jgi:sec-independent protein translocase protein TatC
MGWRDKIQEMDRNEVFDKLEGLRSALIRIFIVVTVLAGVTFFLWKPALHVLQQPLGLPLVMYSLPEGFLSSLRLAFFTAIFMAAPILFHELWKAFTPLVSFQGRWTSILIVLSATLLFYGGAFFCYFFVLPVGIHFLVTYGTESLKPMIGLSRYLTFSIGLILAFGVVFELPLIFLILGRVGWVSYRWLAKNRKYALLVNSILAAILTPTPDAYTLLLMMVPMQALYELSVWLVRIFGKQKVLEPEPT